VKKIKTKKLVARQKKKIILSKKKISREQKKTKLLDFSALI